MQTARFLGQDPVEEADTNRYRYCGNDPVNKTDPSGLNVKLGRTSEGFAIWKSSDGKIYTQTGNGREPGLRNIELTPAGDGYGYISYEDFPGAVLIPSSCVRGVVLICKYYVNNQDKPNPFSGTSFDNGKMGTGMNSGGHSPSSGSGSMSVGRGNGPFGGGIGIPSGISTGNCRVPEQTCSSSREPNIDAQALIEATLLLKQEFPSIFDYMKKEMIKIVFDRDGLLDFDKSSYDRDSKTIHLRPGMTAGYIAYYIAYRIEELRGYRDYVRLIAPDTPQMTDPGRRSQKWDSAVDRYYKALQDGNSIEIKRAYAEKTRERLACVLNVNSEQELTEEIWDFLYDAFGPQDCGGGKFWDLIALANWQKYQLPDPRSSRAYARSKRSGKGRGSRKTPEDNSYLNKNKKKTPAEALEDIAKYRKDNGLPEYSQTPGSTGTVARIEINGKVYYGHNSTINDGKCNMLSIEARREIFNALKNKGKLKGLENLGQAQFLSHAEAEALLKAHGDLKSKGGIPEKIEIVVDRPTCNNCSSYLGELAGELGVKEITIYWKNQSGQPLVINGI